MKTLVLVVTIIALLIATAFAFLIYRQTQQMNNPTTEPVAEVASTTDEQTAIAKTILTANMDTSFMTPEEQEAVAASIDAQLADDAKLHALALEAGTTVSESTWFFAWQREVYEHTDEAGLAAHIASLGLDEAAYRANLERNLLITTFLENKAAPRVTDASVQAYYDSLPIDGRDDFATMAEEIRETLLAEATIAVRAELLRQ
jgi:hypothetical protein